jgi:hypothetical protein
MRRIRTRTLATASATAALLVLVVPVSMALPGNGSEARSESGLDIAEQARSDARGVADDDRGASPQSEGRKGGLPAALAMTTDGDFGDAVSELARSAPGAVAELLGVGPSGEVGAARREGRGPRGAAPSDVPPASADDRP